MQQKGHQSSSHQLCMLCGAWYRASSVGESWLAESRGLALRAPRNRSCSLSVHPSLVSTTHVMEEARFRACLCSGQGTSTRDGRSHCIHRLEASSGFQKIAKHAGPN